MRNRMFSGSLGALLLIAIFLPVTESEAAVRRRIVRGNNARWRAPANRPPAPPKPPAPKILQASGIILLLNPGGKSLLMMDDDTKANLNLMLTPETKYTKEGKAIVPVQIKGYEHVTVSYQDTDRAVKELKVTPAPKAAAAAAAKAKPAKAPKQKN